MIAFGFAASLWTSIALPVMPPVKPGANSIRLRLIELAMFWNAAHPPDAKYTCVLTLSVGVTPLTQFAGAAQPMLSVPAPPCHVYCAAFAADPSLNVTLWGLRRLLSRAGLWSELADAYRAAAEAVATTASGEARARRTRADLVIERGRLLAVGSVADISARAQEQSTVRVRVLRDFERLQGWLAARGDVTELRMDGDLAMFSHAGDREGEAALLRSMVEHGFPVVEFGAKHKSLEDVFLHVTEGRVQ